MLPEHNVYVHEEDDTHTCKIAVGFQRGFHRRPVPNYNLATAEWTVDEDKLIIACEARGEDNMQKVYLTYCEDAPDAFGKPNVTNALLCERLSDLKRKFPDRYNLVKSTTQHTADGNKALIAFKRMKRKQEGLPNDLTIICDNNEKVKANADTLRKSSLKIEAYLNANPFDGERERVLHLNQSTSPLPGVDHFGAFSAETVKTYVLITSRNDWANERIDLADALNQARVSRDKMWDSIQSDMQSKRQSYLSHFESQEAEELSLLTSTLDTQLEKDIRTLRTLYGSHITHEKKLITERYGSKVQEVNKYFDTETEKLHELLTQPEGQLENVDVLTEQLKIADNAVAGLYRDDMLPKLLILSEMIQAMGLKESVVDMIAAKPLKHLMSSTQEMGCQLIRSKTLQEILTKLDVKDFLKLNDSKHLIPKELVMIEYQTREAMASEAYRNKETEELHRLEQSGGEAFKKVLEAELQRRLSEVKDTSVVLKQVKGNVLLLSHDRLAVSLLQHKKYGTALATHGRASGVGWGNVYWEALIDTFEEVIGLSCGIGWEAVRSTKCTIATPIHEPQRTSNVFRFGKGQEGVPGLSPGQNGLYGVVLVSNGSMYYNGASEETRTKFSPQDCIGVLLDLTNGTTTFSKNGLAIPKCTDLPIHHEGHYHVAPVMSIYSASAKQRLKVVANFSGPFRHPPNTSFSPYSRQASYHAKP